MKKIVGILAAAAVLATSVFAADVSAKVKLNGSLFNVDGTNDKSGVSALSIQHNTDESWNPVINMSTSGDNFGASVGIYVGNWNATKMGAWNSGYGLGAKEWKIWIKPIDVLKFNFGRIAASTFTDTIAYSNNLMGYDEWGYQAEFASSGFALNIGLHVANPGDNWLYQAVKKDAAGNEVVDAAGNKVYGTFVSGVGVKASYSADFGEIIAMFDANKTFETIKAAVGYKNQFGDLGLFFDAGLFYTKDQKATKRPLGTTVADELGFGADIDVKYAKDAFYIEGYARFKMNQLQQDLKTGYTLKDKTKPFAYDNVNYANPMEIFLLLKASYKLDPVTIYATFKDENFLANRYTKTGLANSPTVDYLWNGTTAFISEIKVGLTGNVGAASWDIGAQINTGNGDDFDKIKFSVPVEFVVAW